MMMLSLQAMAYDFSYTYQGKTLYYDITSGSTIKVTYYSSNNYVNGDVVIPSSVEYNGTTYSVTSIGYSAFYGCSSLTSVTIPNSVTSIGDKAFENCSSLASVTIPTGVTSIGGSTFSGCSGLTSVTIPNSVTSIGSWAFSDCSGLTSVTIPTGVTSIEANAFRNCSGLTSVTIPTGVTSIGWGAFQRCSGLTSVTIPTGVTFIGQSAFRNCSSLTSVTIPTGVTSIEGYTFSGCTGLTSVTIGNSITSIGEEAFRNCSGLTSITIPTGVTSIDMRAFSECIALTSVRCLTVTPPSIDNTSFYNVPSTCTLAVPCGSIGAYAGSDWNGCFAGRISEEFVFEFTASANDATFGSVAVSTGESCNEKIMTATPNEGYEFTGWNDGNTENPRTVTITSDTAFVAIFTETETTPTITVTVNDATMGSATYTLDGNTVVLTATPNEGYEFTGWNDGNTENPRTVTVTSDTAFVAIFTASGSSSLQEVNAREFAMYPNPAKSFVTLEFETLQENALLQILDINGRKVRTLELKAGVEALRIDVSDLPKGVYTITIGNTTKKLIVE